MPTQPQIAETGRTIVGLRVAQEWEDGSCTIYQIFSLKPLGQRTMMRGAWCDSDSPQLPFLPGEDEAWMACVSPLRPDALLPLGPDLCKRVSHC